MKTFKKSYWTWSAFGTLPRKGQLCFTWGSGGRTGTQECPKWPRGCICSLTVHLTHMSWHPCYHVGRQAPCSWEVYKLPSPKQIHLCSAVIYWLSRKQKQFVFPWAFHFTSIQNNALKEWLMCTHLTDQTRCSWAVGPRGSPPDQDQHLVSSVLMRL